jgi:acyl-ACP thioesterase
MRQPHRFTELVDPAPDARVFSAGMRAGLGDCAPTGRIRLDALARWLQDVAYGDVEDAGLEDTAIWVVRRNRIRVARFPRFAQPYIARTYCSGIGRMWAERRTTFTREGAAQPDVESVALWVHLDPHTRRPAPFEEREILLYGDAAAARRVTARLRHPAPPQAADRSGWTFRATECDLAEHINNAAYWQPVEATLLLSGPEPERLDTEMEFRTPAQPGEKHVLWGGEMCWIVSPAGETHASVVLDRAA